MQTGILRNIFIYNRHNPLFVFKFSKINNTCKNIRNYWLTHLLSYKYLINLNISRFIHLKKLHCTQYMKNNTLKQLKYINYLKITYSYESSFIYDCGYCIYDDYSDSYIVKNFNDNLNNNGLKHLRLHTLISSTVIDVNYKKLNLHILSISYDTTNSSFTHMNLKYLDHPIITNNTLKNMYLHTLYAKRTNITDDGLLHLQLHTFSASTDITNIGIKHMQLYDLDASNSNITYEGVSHMNLYSYLPKLFL